MSPAFACRIDRGDFGDLLTVRGLARTNIAPMSIEEVVTEPLSGPQAMLVAWSRDPRETGQLPELLVCEDGTESDWAAWISTYAARIRPFSAYSRLLGVAEARTLLSAWRSTPDLKGLTWPLVGVVLGEVLAASGLPDRALESAPAVLCTSTLSFALFRAAALYASFEPNNVVDRWTLARSATGRQTRAFDAAVTRACKTIIEAAELGKPGSYTRNNDMVASVAICRELIDDPTDIPRSLARVPAFGGLAQVMRGPREDRVVALERFFRELPPATAQSFDRESVAMLLGYLTSRIAPGTMRHSAMLRGVADRYPAALLWYGFCAALSAKGTEGAKGTESQPDEPGDDLPASGRRIARELLRREEFLGPPSADVGVLELLALSRLRREALAGVIATTQGTMTVELIPGVVTAISWPLVRQSAPEEAPVGSGAGAAVAARRDDSTARFIERELRALSERIDRLRRDLDPQRGVADDAEAQRTLFDPRRRKR